MNTQRLESITLEANHPLIKSVQDAVANANAEVRKKEQDAVAEGLKKLMLKTQLSMCACLLNYAIQARDKAKEAKELAYQAYVQACNGNKGNADSGIKEYGPKARVNERVAAARAVAERSAFSVSDSDFSAMLDSSDSGPKPAGKYEQDFEKAQGSDLASLAQSLANTSARLGKEFTQGKTEKYYITMAAAYRAASDCAILASDYIKKVLEYSPLIINPSVSSPFSLVALSVPYDWFVSATVSYDKMFELSGGVCYSLARSVRAVDFQGELRAYEPMPLVRLLASLKGLVASLGAYRGHATAVLFQRLYESFEGLEISCSGELLGALVSLNHALSLSLMESLLKVRKDGTRLKKLEIALKDMRDLGELGVICKSLDSLGVIETLSEALESESSTEGDIPEVSKALGYVAGGFLELAYEQSVEPARGVDVAGVNAGVVQAFFCEVDYRAVKLDRYDPSLLLGVNAGHWDLYGMRERG